MAFLFETANKKIKDIADKVFNDQRISRDEAIELYKNAELTQLAYLANYVRIKKAKHGYEKHVWWNTNLHLNPTNVCIGTCNFCAFAKRPNEEGAYTMSIEEATKRATNAFNLGATEVHIVGGLNPKAALPYYSELLASIKSSTPKLHIKAFTAVEIAFFSKLHKLTPLEVISRLQKAGLDSMPGGGAEVFAKSVRDETCPDKIPAEQWLEIHAAAHSLGLRSNATMLAGIGEEIEDRIDHMLYLRDQQDKSKGFQTFIPLSCHYEDTDIAGTVRPITDIEKIKNIAVGRIVLDNFDHIKAYWVQLGYKMAQLALHHGADDIDGTVVDERITNAAGAANKATQADYLKKLVIDEGYIPSERDTLYNLVERNTELTAVK